MKKKLPGCCFSLFLQQSQSNALLMHMHEKVVCSIFVKEGVVWLKENDWQKIFSFLASVVVFMVPIKELEKTLGQSNFSYKAKLPLKSFP